MATMRILVARTIKAGQLVARGPLGLVPAGNAAEKMLFVATTDVPPGRTLIIDSGSIDVLDAASGIIVGKRAATDVRHG